MSILDEALSMETYSEWLQTKGKFWSLVLEIKSVRPGRKDKKDE